VKILYALFIFCMVAGACSTPKKTIPRENKIPRADVLKGGTSFTNAIVILVQSEREVLDEEYKWLSYSYTGYALSKRTHIRRSSKHYDIIRIKTKQGQVRDIYFDCTAFWAKN
jgi:predicted RNA-binding protein associated with RNAse of E/G family